MRCSEGTEPTGEDGLYSVPLRFTIVGVDRRIGRVASIADGHSRQSKTARGARHVIAQLTAARTERDRVFAFLASHRVAVATKHLYIRRKQYSASNPQGTGTSIGPSTDNQYTLECSTLNKKLPQFLLCISQPHQLR